MKSTALEILSEPLTLLLLLTALVITVLAPVFHYHQFGEATRMARDAGLSAIFTCASALGVFATIRTFRREIETGTAEMALAHPISRTGFFCAKLTGAIVAYMSVVSVLFGILVSMVCGAEIGGRIAERTGGLMTVWGPAVSAGVGTILLPLILGAIANRFFGMRFVLSAMTLSTFFAVISPIMISVYLSWDWFFRLIPVVYLISLPAVFLIVVAASASARYKANAAAAVTAVALLSFVPFLGNYYLADALTDGGVVDFATCIRSTVAILPAIAAFFVWGVSNERHRT